MRRVLAFLRYHEPGVVVAYYLRRKLAQGEVAGSRPSLREWSELDEFIRESNRQQADHIPVKLRAIGCRSEPCPPGRGTGGFAFTPEVAYPPGLDALIALALALDVRARMPAFTRLIECAELDVPCPAPLSMTTSCERAAAMAPSGR